MFTSMQLSLKGTRNDPGILDLVESGRIVVPRFQREFVWKLPKSVNLVRSVAQGWPTGSLLLMEWTGEFPSKTLKYVPSDGIDVDRADYAVLDGQQRLTAINLVLRSHPKGYRMFVRLGDICKNEGEIFEDDFGVLSSGKYEEECDGQPASRGILQIRELWDDNLWQAWLEGVKDKGLREAYTELRQTELHGLKDYQMPAQIIKKNAPNEVVTNVFVTINQTGVKLSVFDLVVAKCWQPATDTAEEFDLRKLWHVAIGKATEEIDESSASTDEEVGTDEADDAKADPTYARVRAFGVDEVTVLRLTKLIADPTGSVVNSELLGLPAKDVREHFGSAIDLCERTLKILQEETGVVPKSLPSKNGLLPLAYALSEDESIESDSDKRSNLARWFWASAFSQRYGKGGTNRLILKDAVAAAKWISGGSVDPDWIARFWDGFGPDDLIVYNKMNENLLRGILTLQLHAGARDWIQHSVVIKGVDQVGTAEATGKSQTLDSHHIFPKDNDLPDPGGKLSNGSVIPSEISRKDDDEDEDARNLVLNRVLILASTNRKIGNSAPGALGAVGSGDNKVDFAAVDTHLIDHNTFDSWSDFIADRADRVLAQLKLVLPPLGK